MTYEQLTGIGQPNGSKLLQLLAGEIADDFGNTAPSGEAWERVTTTRLVSPGTTINAPTNINSINMYLDFLGETDPQESVSFTITCTDTSTFPTTGPASQPLRLQAFENGALVNDTDLVAYWVSVTEDRIIMAVQGDTAHSGNMNLLYFGTYTRLYTAVQDPYPVVGIVSHVHTGEYFLNAKERGQLARTDNAVDWLDDRNSAEWRLYTTQSIINSNPNVWDNKWYLYTLYIVGNRTGNSSAELGYRGKLLDLYQLDDNGWTNRDILTDGVDSWRLIFPFRSNDTASAQNIQNLGNSGKIYFAFKQV